MLNRIDETDLEPGSERIARFIGAVITAGTLAYLGAIIGTEDSSDPVSGPLAWVFLLAWVSVPAIVAVVFSLAHVAVSSYLARGLAALFAFAVGAELGTEYGPQSDVGTGWVFMVSLVWGGAMLVGGLAVVITAKFAKGAWRLLRSRNT